MLRVLLGILITAVISTAVLSLSRVQTYLGKLATDNLNATFGTNIQIGKVQLSFLTWDIALKDIFIEDYQRDTLAQIGRLNTSILGVKDLLNGKLQFGQVQVDQLFLKMTTYPNAPDTNLGIFIDKLDDGQPREPGTDPFFLNAEGLKIENSRFSLRDENEPNPQILNFSNLNIEAADFNVLGPEVWTEIQALSFHSSRGFQVLDLKTAFRYTPEQMQFKQLSLVTDESALEGELIFDYKREDLPFFTDRVQLSARFINSRLGLSDINRFYSGFGQEKSASIKAEFKGTLNALSVRNLELSTDVTQLRGNFKFFNMFGKSPFNMEGEVNELKTSYDQLRSLMPEILGGNLPNELKYLGFFGLKGNLKLSEASLQTHVNLKSHTGSATANLSIEQYSDLNRANYKGDIVLEAFDLKSFLPDSDLGPTSLNVNVEGQGFTSENLNVEVIGDISKFTYRNYVYTDLDVSGILKDQLFDGSLNGKDPNLIFNFKGLADFGSIPNSFDFVVSIDRADLFKTGFVSDSIAVFSGDLSMNVLGDDLDSFEGGVKFNKTKYTNPLNTYYFDDFQITSAFESDSIRTITINSPDIINGKLSGSFKLGELGKMVQNAMGSIYTNYKPYKIADNQEVNFNFRIYNKIIELFFPGISFEANTYIRGEIQSDVQNFKLNFRSPGIAAFGNQFKEVEIRVDNQNPLFNTYVAMADIQTAYYDINNFELINTTLNDTLFFRTEFKGGPTGKDFYNLNFYHTFNAENKSVIGLKKSDLSFKGNPWYINPEGNSRNKITFDRRLDSIEIEEFVMSHANREVIALRGMLADSTYKNIALEFKSVALDKITPELDSLALGGQLNGLLNVRQDNGTYLPAGNLQISNFTLNNFNFGDLDFGIVGNNDLSEFSVNTQITKNNREIFSVIGTVSNQQNTPQARLTASFYDFDLEPFSPLGDGVIDKIRGRVEGSALILGNLTNPNITGALVLRDAGFGIPYLNVNYGFGPVANVGLNNQSFNFQNVRLRDELEGTTAILDGAITHKYFADWRLDLKVDTQNQRFMILNTDFDEEELYYGKAFAVGTGLIYGPTTSLNIEFEGTTGKGTSLKIPISDVASLGDYSFINFIERNQSQILDEEENLNDYQGLELKFDLDVTPDAEVEIVIDQQTGSALKGTGVGLIFMEINTNGKFNMWGDFVAVTGQYRYKYGGILDKTFKVKPGGTINWDGDPLAAQLDLEAVYSLNANPAPLLEDVRYARSLPTEVVVRLTGELEQPTIDFNIEFPGTSSIVQSELEYRLQDPTVEERNAIFLLAQGTFVNENTGLNQQAVTGNLLQTATSGLFNQVLGSDSEKLNLGVSYEAGYVSPNTAVDLQDRIGVTVRTQISDRILFNGRFGVPIGGVTESAVAGDAEVQLLLNEQGTLSMRIFNRQNDVQQFLTDQQGYTQGVGLSYEVDFNSFRELLRYLMGTRR
ncbi:MAG: hypothetical protein RLZZ241_922 [Bacteroidota bacterium]